MIRASEAATKNKQRENRPHGMDNVIRKTIKPGQHWYDVVFSPSGAYHVLFWAIVTLILSIIESIDSRFGFWFIITNEILNVLFFALVVYFNLLYLIPQYLAQKRFLTYSAWLVFSVVIITPLKMFVFHLKFMGHPELQSGLMDDELSFFIVTFLVAVVSTVYKIMTDWVTYLRDKQELETQTMQSELRFLKSQINPHFLFNTLNNLYALTLKKSDQAPEIVIKLSEMMRYMLYDCNEKRVPLSKEVAYLHNYLDLERLRQGPDAQINFEVIGPIGEQRIAPLLFIPFMENSFKHGLNHHISQGGFVNIRLEIKGDCVHFHIENSKPEKVPLTDPNRRSGGIGLVNVHRRLNLMYSNKYDLKIANTPKLYAVDLKIELDN